MNLQKSATSPQGPVSDPSLTASRTNQTTLSLREAKEIWEHAILLFRNYDWSEAIIHIQRLLRRSRNTPGLNHAALWANLGILRMHLGEYYLALEAFKKAMEKARVSVEKATDPDGTPRNPMLTLEPSSAAALPDAVSASAASPAAAPTYSAPHSPHLGPRPRPRYQPSSHAAGAAGATSAHHSSSSSLITGAAPALAADLRTDATLIKRTTAALVRHHQHHEGAAGGGPRNHRSDNNHLSGGRRRDWAESSDNRQHHPLRRPHAPTITTAAIYPFLAGLAAYHLPRDDDGDGGASKGLRFAQRLFRTCLSLLPLPGGEGVGGTQGEDADEVKVDMTPLGLAWTLERTRVVWNTRICGVKADWEEGRGDLIAGKHWGVNGMPGGLCFEFVEG